MKIDSNLEFFIEKDSTQTSLKGYGKEDESIIRNYRSRQAFSFLGVHR